MNLRVIIVDDEENMRMVLRKALTRIGNIDILGEANNGEDAIKLVDNYKPNCVFLDVEMLGCDGITAAKKIADIEPKTMIVFITAHQEYMPQAFELYAFDYIVKPFKLERLTQTINRINNLLSNSKETADNKRIAENAEPYKLQKILFKVKDGKKIIDPQDIILIQRENRMTAIITSDEKFIVSETLSELEELLPKDKFMRSHKSYLINMDNIIETYPYGRWTHIVKFKNIKEDALITSDKLKEFQAKFNIQKE